MDDTEDRILPAKRKPPRTGQSSQISDKRPRSEAQATASREVIDVDAIQPNKVSDCVRMRPKHESVIGHGKDAGVAKRISPEPSNAADAANAPPEKLGKSRPDVEGDDSDNFLAGGTVKNQLQQELALLQPLQGFQFEEGASVVEDAEFADVESDSTVDDRAAAEEVADPEGDGNADPHPGEGEAASGEAVQESSLNHEHNANKKKRNKKHGPFWKPRLWDRKPIDKEAKANAKKSLALICGETSIELDPSGTTVKGTLWSEIMREKLPTLLRTIKFVPLPSGKERNDFLKAVNRLGRMVEPQRLSTLLGGGHRSPEYCEFVLRGFLGLLNNPKVRKRFFGEENAVSEDPCGDVIVYGDQLYPSDDELLIKEGQFAEVKTAERSSGLQATPGEHDRVTEVLLSDKPEDDELDDAENLDACTAHELKYRDESKEIFAKQASYILRNYMHGVSGFQLSNLDDFKAFCGRTGMTFVDERGSREHKMGRLKWLKEPMSAPGLGRGRVITEPLELWKHARKRWSLKNLSRCALIRVDPLLDWLGYVANERVMATSEEEFYRLKRPVVSIAPVPLLYLADQTANFVLRVLSMAVLTASRDLTEGELSDKCCVIEAEDVSDAVRRLFKDPQSSAGFYLHSDTPWSAEGLPVSDMWPRLVQRPLTQFEAVDLCDRVPKACVTVPMAVTEEMRALVMSFWAPVKMRLYTNHRLLKQKDPTVFMDPEEKNEFKRKWRERNRAQGITWGRPGSNSKEEERSNDEDHKKEGLTLRIASDNIHDEATANAISNANLRDQILNDETEKRSNRTASADGTEPVQSSEHKTIGKIPTFFDVINMAEVAAHNLGEDELVRRKVLAGSRYSKNVIQAKKEAVKGSVEKFLEETMHDDERPSTTVCTHRLAWICFQALGISSEELLDDDHPMGYGSLVNYTNFRDCGIPMKVSLSKGALLFLLQIADVLVRSEGELLMDCAVHDDGRPWIDRADVALITSVRKEEFRYKGL